MTTNEYFKQYPQDENGYHIISRLFIPFILPSPNKQEHWTKRHRRNSKIKQIIILCLKTDSNASNLRENTKDMADFMICNKLEISRVSVNLERFGRKLDEDNLIYAFKPVRDCIASFFFPSLAPGQADGLEIFNFTYSQSPATMKNRGIEITLGILYEK